MKIALTQMDIVWENKEANMCICEKLVKQASENGAKLIVFPEMTLTGFTMNTDYAGEDRLDGGVTTEFFKKISKMHNIAIVYGMVCKEKDDLAYNKAVMVNGDNILFDYSKIHPFSYGQETNYYEKGQNIITTAYGGIDIGCFVCYDLRFPEIFQVSSKKNQVIIVIANWPKPRVMHWDALLRARAIENQAFIIGVNRTGEGDGLLYEESSVVYSPYGERITEKSQEEIIYADIDIKEVLSYRKEFPLKDDRREELYKTYYS